MKISGAIFDMDGTLLDSMYVWKDIGKKYIKSCGIEPNETIYDEIKDLSFLQTIDYLKRNYGLIKSSDEILLGINSLVEPMYRYEVMPKAGVFELLEKFKKLGVKMCVATATDRYLVEMVLKRTGLMNYFSRVFTCQEEGAGKDTPIIYKNALLHLGTPISETLVFEDALYAIKTAKNFGFKVVGIKDDSSENEADEIKSLCDFYITDYRLDTSYFDRL